MAVFTDVGRKWVVDAINRVVTTKQEYIDWGTGAVAEAAGNTGASFTFGGETRIGPSGSGTTLSNVTTTVTGDTSRLTGTLTATGNKTITESGRFDNTVASGTSILLSRSLFTGIPLLTGDAIAFTLDFKVT